MNRPSAVYQLSFSLDQPEACAKFKLERVSRNDRSARSPRVHTMPSGSKHLYYLSNQSGFQTDSGASLHRRNWPVIDATSEDTLVGPVHDPYPAAQHPDPFPGIHAASFSESCFLLLSNMGGAPISYVLLNSPWRSRSRLVLVCAQNGHTSTDDPDEFTSFRLLGTDGLSFLLGVRSGPGTLPELVLGKHPSISTIRSILPGNASRLGKRF